MYLTLDKAIELCLELWEWCAETGKCKKFWPKWEQYAMYYDARAGIFAGRTIPVDPSAFAYCWFCLYAKQEKKDHQTFLESACQYCPLYQQLGYCSRIKSYSQWWNAGSEQFEEKRKFAAEFVKDIKWIKVCEEQK